MCNLSISAIDRSRWAINGSVVSLTIDRSRCAIGQWVWGMQDCLAWAKLRILSLLQLSVCSGGRVKVSYMRGWSKAQRKLVVLYTVVFVSNSSSWKSG